MAKAAAPKAPGTTAAKTGKTTVRSTMTPVFGGKGKRSVGKRSGRGR